jgi:hypothetical protein
MLASVYLNIHAQTRNPDIRVVQDALALGALDLNALLQTALVTFLQKRVMNIHGVF